MSRDIDDLHPFPLILVKEVSEVVEQEWLVEGLIPAFSEGAAGYLFGPPKARKSMLLSDLALSVATGTRALGHFKVKKSGTVVGFFAEDQKSETARRIRQLAHGRNIEMPDNLFLINIESLSLDDEQEQRRLEATLGAIKDLAFVWLDPMIRLHRVNDNKAEELGPIHTFLRRLSRRCPTATIVLAHHTNKSGDYRGSTEYGAFGDFNLYLDTDGSATSVVRKLEFRGGPPGEAFRFSVEDGESELGKTLQLVVDRKTVLNCEQPDTLIDQVKDLRREHPSLSGKAAAKKLRESGAKFGNKRFFDCWEDAAHEEG